MSLVYIHVQIIKGGCIDKASQTPPDHDTVVFAGLKLGLVLGLLEDRVKLGGLHHVALDLQLSGHEHALSVGLAGDEVTEVGIGQGERN